MHSSLMKYRFYLSLFIFWLLPSFSYAQKVLTVKGKVIDSASGLPVSYVTISLRNQSGVVIKSILNKEDGSFLLENTKRGNYLIIILAVGYRSKSVLAELNDSLTYQANIGDILISTEDKQLQEVVISGNRPLVTQQVDRISYDVKADPESKRENMLELLRKVPLLSLDDQDNIKLKGGSEFKIFINGKPSGVMATNPTMALRAMRAKNVKKIEVITTPSAKYDSEGTAGIINIITNNDLQGYNLIVEAFRNTLIADGVGAAFTVKVDKLGVTGYIGRYSRKNPNLETTVLRAPNQYSRSRVEQNSNTKSAGVSGPFNADLSYEIDSLNLLTGSVIISLEKRNIAGNQFSKNYNEIGNVDYFYNLDSKTSLTEKRTDLSLNYQLGFKKNKDMLLTASYRYLKTNADYNNTNQTDQTFNSPTILIIQQNTSGVIEQTAQLDYVKPSKWLNIEGGIKLIDRKNFSDFNTENNSILSFNQFNYDQGVYSAYNSYQVIQKKWSLKAGLRLESTKVNANFITTQKDLQLLYTNLIPSLALQYKINSLAGFNFGYTQRILRPGILQLNPFENRSNPLIYTSGNPDLEPVKSNNFDLSYNRSGKGNLNVNLNYLRSNNTIQEISTLGSDQITRFTYRNTGSNSAVGFNMSLNYPFSKRFRTNINALIQQVWVEGTVNGSLITNSGLQYTTTYDFSYNLKGDWNLGLEVRNIGPVINLQGQGSGYFKTTFRLNKEFFGNKIGVIANVYDLVPAFRYRKTSLKTTDFFQEIRTKKLATGAYLNIYYNIGQLKEKVTKNKRSVKNDDQEKKKGDPNEL